MKLIARMHQCLEARGNQSISSSDAGRWTRTNLHSVAIDTARKWELKEPAGWKRSGKKNALKYLRRSHLVSASLSGGRGYDLRVSDWQRLCSLRIRGRKWRRNGTAEAEDNGTLFALRRCHKSGRSGACSSHVNHVLCAKPELYTSQWHTCTYALISIHIARGPFSLNILFFPSSFHTCEDLFLHSAQYFASPGKCRINLSR